MRASLLGVAAAGALVVCALAVTDCSNSGNGNADLGPDFAGLMSNCGHPGDKGNTLGVGKFCTSIGDCIDNTGAVLCTTISDNQNFFCTMRCGTPDAGNECGDNAHCACSGGGCGCYPDACP